MVFLVLAASAIAIQVGAWRVASTASEQYAVAGSSAPLSSRLVAARRAASLRPEVIAYGQRLASVQAEVWVANGRLDEARVMLIEQWGRDRSNTELRAQLKEVNEARFTRDSRKAHVLHGREKPGGVLLPEDLLP